MNLTADEIKLIEDYRQVKAGHDTHKRNVSHLLRTADDYFDWLIKHKRESSLSTFMNVYRYQGDFCGGRVPGTFYDRVMDLIQMADEWVSGV